MTHGLTPLAPVAVIAYATFSRLHWRMLWPVSPPERVDEKIKRRTNVIGMFPNDAAVLRLVGAIFAERHDEWQTSGRRYLTMNNVTALELDQPVTLELEAANHEQRRREHHRRTACDRRLSGADSRSSRSRLQEVLRKTAKLLRGKPCHSWENQSE